MRRALLVSLLPIVAVASSCLGATEVMVTISTNDCSALTRTDVYLGTSAQPVTSTGGCTDGQTVGTIALVPSGAIDDQLDITVVGAVGGACSSATTQEAQCIIARRSLSFLPHQRLDLPIFLDKACANTHCQPNETCVADPTPHCKSKECDTADGVTCEVDAGGADVQVPDVTVDSPVVDAATCPVLVQQPTFSWSFDNTPTDAVHEDHELTKPEAFTGATLGKDPLFCGTFLQLKTSSQYIASNNPNLGNSSLTIGFAYNVSGDGSLLRLESSQLSNGLVIAIDQGSLIVAFEKNFSLEVYRDGGNTANGLWHTAVVEITSSTDDSGTPSSTIRVTRDGVVGKLALAATDYPAGSVTLSAGPIVGALDQITYTGF